MAEGIITQNNFQGYEHHDDITTQNPNTLAYGSHDVLIVGNTNNAVESRNGYTILGESNQGSFVTPIRSKYDKYVNNSGVSFAVREYEIPSGSQAGQSCVEVFYNNNWYRISQNGISGVHESYFTSWTNPDTLINELIWVNGNVNVFYWSGSISTISNLTATTITLSEVGATAAFDTAGTIEINGTTYTYTGKNTTQLTGLTTSPIAGGVVIGDVAIQKSKTGYLQLLGNNLSTSPQLDIVSVLENHIFYGSYKSRNIYVSASKNFPAQYFNTATTATFDNLIVSGTPTSTIKKKVVINTSSVTPEPIYGAVTASGSYLRFTGDYDLPSRAKFKVIVTSVTSGTSMTFNWWYEADYNTAYSASPNGSITIGPTSVGSTIPLTNGVGVFVYALEGSSSPADTYTLEIGGADQYTYTVYDGETVIASGGPTPMSTDLVYDGVTFHWNSYTGHKIGDSWTYVLYPAVTHGFLDIYYDDPRLATQGFTQAIDSPPIGFITQEKSIYINSQNGFWTQTQFQLSADLQSTTVTFEKLKSNFNSRMIRQSYVGNSLNDVLYLTIENIISSLGRIELIQTPQTKPISDKIKIDLKSANFIPFSNGNLVGSIFLADNKLFITCPDLNTIWIYDYDKGFWQPPQNLPVSHVTTIGNTIVGHSSIKNESYVLFNGSNDNGLPIFSRVVFPYNNYGERALQKSAKSIFTEGYMNAQSDLTESVYFEYGGCKQVFTQKVDPIICDFTDKASLGKAPLGGRGGLGNDPVTHINKFRKLDSVGSSVCFYEASIVYEQTTIDAYFRLVTTGLELVDKGCDNIKICKFANRPQPGFYEGTPGTEGYSNYINPGKSITGNGDGIGGGPVDPDGPVLSPNSGGSPVDP